MSMTLYDLISNAVSVTKSDVAKLHDPDTTEEEEAKILKALEETGYENLPG